MTMSPWHEVRQRLQSAAPTYKAYIVADGPGLLETAGRVCGGADSLVLPWHPAVNGESAGEKRSGRFILQVPEGMIPGCRSETPAEAERTFQLLRYPADIAGLVEKKPAGILFSLGFVSNRPGGFLLLADAEQQARMPSWPAEGSPDHRGIALRRCCSEILLRWDPEPVSTGSGEEIRNVLIGAAADPATWRATVWTLELPLLWLLEPLRLAWLERGMELPLPATVSAPGALSQPPFERVEPWL